MALAAMVVAGSLLFACGLVLQGASGSEGEGLAIGPEDAMELRDRLAVVLRLISIAAAASMIFHVFLALFRRTRIRQAIFLGLVSWGCFGLFFGLIILAGSFQSRDEVPREYRQLAGGAGALALLSIGLAAVFAEKKPAEPVA